MEIVWEKMTKRMMMGLNKEEVEIFEHVASRIGENIEQMLNEETQ